MPTTLPCPFCRSTRVRVEALRQVDGDRYHVHCDECGADGPPAKTGAEALAKWNTRPSGH